jgi:hypothetical protein
MERLRGSTPIGSGALIWHPDKCKVSTRPDEPDVKTTRFSGRDAQQSGQAPRLPAHSLHSNRLPTIKRANLPLSDGFRQLGSPALNIEP